MIYNSQDPLMTKIWVNEEEDLDIYLAVYEYTQKVNLPMQIYNITKLPSVTLIIL